MRIPRKKKKQIPKGVYCYTATSGFKTLKNGNYGYSIRSCCFYKHIESIDGHCKFLNCEIMDQIKECGINNHIKKNETF